MTDSLPSPHDRAISRRDTDDAGGSGVVDDAAQQERHSTRHDTEAAHDEQPGFPDEPVSPAEGGD